MTNSLQASCILIAAVVATSTLAARSRRNLPTLSLLVRCLYHVARFAWCIAEAADRALFAFRDEWRETREQIRPINEMWWRAENADRDR